LITLPLAIINLLEAQGPRLQLAPIWPMARGKSRNYPKWRI
jgi:hypothetical protein